MRDWISRESYLELNRRERHGLPLIDPNLIPLERISLPTEEELGEEFVIIV
jgi:NADH dehydrogenase (ubiquinone) 1 beta subcomplex subunit 11